MLAPSLYKKSESPRAEPLQITFESTDLPVGIIHSPPHDVTLFARRNCTGPEAELRDDGRSSSYPRVGYRIPCFRLGAFLGLEDGRRR